MDSNVKTAYLRRTKTLAMRFSLLALPFCLLFITGCKNEPATGSLPEIHLIPKPSNVTLSAEVFQLNFGNITAPPELSFEANWLASMIKAETGIELIQRDDDLMKSSFILKLDSGIASDEGYRLEVTPSLITLSGNTAAGVFYAIQTLRQLLPIDTPKKNDIINIPCVSIEDAPRFPYRGMHLDVSRHFFDIDVVKRYLDMMARYKFNYFHWHLTDDQGWRVQIDKYPKLNTISSWRNETLIGHHNDLPWRFDGKRHGGFYTKDQIREIVVYAAERHITVVPEIEMPGHAQAILAAYPEYGCTNRKVEVRKVWGISDEVLCPHEATFTFLEDVLTEVIDLFPGKYIHIGGDECPKTQWEQSAFCQDLMKRENLADEMALQSWFVQRIERFINSKGRTMIGWDEILEGGLAPNAVVMSWRGNTGGIDAAKQGHDVIMTPTTHVYLDYYQSLHPEEPYAIGGYLPLETVYGFEPIPAELTAEQHKHILGAQGNVWTEYIETPLKLDYMAWPRGIAIAELTWSQADQRNFSDFATRLEPHLQRLRNDGVYAANHLFDLSYRTRSDSSGLYLDFIKLIPDIIVNYSVDGEQTWQSIATPLKIDSSMTMIARSEGARGLQGRALQVEIDKHLAAGKSITVVNAPDPKYNHSGIQSLINGIQGSDLRFGDNEWRGFSGTSLEATIDLGAVTTVTSFETRCFEGHGQWIYLPAKIEVSFSLDGNTYSEPIIVEKMGSAGKSQYYKATTSPTGARYVKVFATNFGTIPEGNEGAGHAAWLFVDELVVR